MFFEDEGKLLMKIVIIPVAVLLAIIWFFIR